MKIRIAYTVELTPEEVKVFLVHARLLGLDYGDADERTILRRLHVRYGHMGAHMAFEEHEEAKRFENISKRHEGQVNPKGPRP